MKAAPKLLTGLTAAAELLLGVAEETGAAGPQSGEQR